MKKWKRKVNWVNIRIGKIKVNVLNVVFCSCWVIECKPLHGKQSHLGSLRVKVKVKTTLDRCK